MNFKGISYLMQNKEGMGIGKIDLIAKKSKKK